MANSLSSTQVIATSTTSPKSNTVGKTVKVCQFKLSDIPSTMRKKGWTVAPKLMERWFSNPAWAITPEDKQDAPGTLDIQRAPAQIDTANVTMQWFLGIPRARSLHDQLLNGTGEPGGMPRWKNPKAKNSLVTKLRRSNKFTNQVEIFGQGLSSPQLSNQCLLNEIKYDADARKDPLDDLFGALGDFVIRVAGAGRVEPKFDENKKVIGHRIHIERVGVFIRDVYDFNGFQPLGLWNFSDVKKGLGTFNPNVALDQQCSVVETSKPPSEEDYFEVENADFEAYRKKFGKGGDFVVYSDVAWHSVTHSWDV